MNLVDDLTAGDRRALARAISAVEDGGPEAAAVLAELQSRVGKAAVIGFTGPPGAGKSTLISAYITHLRRAGRSVGVIAVDPSSPLTGGAVLGDRARMASHIDDDGVFIRSLAARGHLGGLSAAAPFVVDLMDAAGFDVVIIETVGTGQSEVEIAGLAGITVVVFAPGLGDHLQAIKAGIMEIATVLVVNKGDSPLAAATAAHLYAALHLNAGGHREVPIVTTTATTGDGVGDLAETIAGLLSVRPPSPADAPRRLRRMLAALAAENLKEKLLRGTNPEIDSICDEVRGGRLGLAEALRQLARIA
ncbi:MAG TPA: methylmalonyl Co-A mutase-associated GTPase MeaB [Rhodospirillaceae bacterium]|nr:methylmalonyl Co-A mutase-associated GTPase MeaB [Rhodospirillaceae bacterium]